MKELKAPANDFSRRLTLSAEIAMILYHRRTVLFIHAKSLYTCSSTIFAGDAVFLSLFFKLILSTYSMNCMFWNVGGRRTSLVLLKRLIKHHRLALLIVIEPKQSVAQWFGINYDYRLHILFPLVVIRCGYSGNILLFVCWMLLMVSRHLICNFLLLALSK